MQGVGVSGAALMLAGRMNSLEPACLTDGRFGEVEELQATLDEGPGADALGSGRPILVGDLAGPVSVRRWPTFAAAVSRLGVCGMYSLPLALGALQVGVLDLYNDTPGHLNQEQLLDALIYADTALLLVLDAHNDVAVPVDSDYPHGHSPVLWHATVHQAAGMISEQLGVSALEALVRLRGYAHEHRRRLDDVAHAVVEGRMWI